MRQKFKRCLFNLGESRLPGYVVKLPIQLLIKKMAAALSAESDIDQIKPNIAAVWYYKIADAMLEARK